MKVLLIAALVFFAGVNSAKISPKHSSLVQLEVKLRNAIEDAITDAIENLRPTLEENDPLNLSDYNLNVSLPDVTLDTVVNGLLSGFSQFNLDSVSFSVLQFVAEVVLSVETLNFNGTSSGTGSFEGQALEGSGPVSATVNNGVADLIADVSLDGLNPVVDSLETLLSLDSLDFLISGLGDSDTDNAISSSVSNDIPSLVADNQQVISDALEPILLPIVNEIVQSALSK